MKEGTEGLGSLRRDRTPRYAGTEAMTTSSVSGLERATTVEVR